MKPNKQEMITLILELIKLKELAIKQRRDCREFKRLSHDANVLFFEIVEKIEELTNEQTA
jgi:hypothetical protein